MAKAPAKKKTGHWKKEPSESGLWKGSISFGLVNIPVRIISSKEDEGLHFTMLDPSNMSPVGYKYYNKANGKEVTRSKTVKGYKYKGNDYVLLSDADFAKANPKATQTLDIEDFVEYDSIEPVYFDRTYYLLPQKNGIKGYTLLRDVLLKNEKAAIAKIVMHNKQHLAAIAARSDFLILELLHFSDEVKALSELKELEKELPDVKISASEMKMAESLVADMTGTWKPEKYKDTYRLDLMKQIEHKYKSGKATEITHEKVSKTEDADENVIDLMPLLKRSLESVGKKSSHAKAPRATKAKHSERRAT